MRFGIQAPPPASTRNRQMEIFDLLGPQARNACRESPRDVDAQVMLGMWRNKMGMSLREDMLMRPLSDPVADASLAELITEKVRRAFGPQRQFGTARRKRRL